MRGRIIIWTEVGVIYRGACLCWYSLGPFQAHSIICGHENKWPWEIHIHADASSVPSGSLCSMRWMYHVRSVHCSKISAPLPSQKHPMVLALLRVGATSRAGKATFPQQLFRAPSFFLLFFIFLLMLMGWWARGSCFKHWNIVFHYLHYTLGLISN